MGLLSQLRSQTEITFVANYLATQKIMSLCYENHKYKDRHPVSSALIDLKLEVRITSEPALAVSSPQPPH